MLIRKLRKKEEDLFIGSHFEMFIITIIILLTIFLTSGIASPIFFLLYFLVFGISFMFEPAVIFVMLACVLLLFGQEALTGDIYSNMLKMGSLILLSPLAFFFGNEYKRREKIEKIEEQIAAEAKKIEKQADSLIKDESETLDEAGIKTVEKIRKTAHNIKEEIKK